MGGYSPGDAARLPRQEISISLRRDSGTFLIQRDMKPSTMGDELILHILLALAVLGVTTICGLPFNGEQGRAP